MRLLVFVLLALQCMLPSVALAMTPAEKNAQCGALAMGEWSYAADTEAEALARSFLDKAHLNYTPVVCLGHPPPGTRAFAEGHVVTTPSQPYFFVLIHADMRIALFGELRGLIAHEVSHLAVPESRGCGSYFFDGKLDAYVACEHAVDAVGESLAGKGEVRRALQFLMTYIERAPWGHEMTWAPHRDVLRRRMQLLE